MPPHQVIESFLSSVYGTNEANRDVVAGILGGDLSTISTRTEVELRLSAVSQEVYRLRNTITYRFRRNVEASHFIVFATRPFSLRRVPRAFPGGGQVPGMVSLSATMTAHRSRLSSV
ncbi:hypothetical protein [Amycolatopsis sp. GM8]|uniref:hypothetical protein n=1 Tax=Amycolatopsis sp. GM8 TaxID=2896530 RepID=UPI001F198315|nr:hypothetical protein [Amycolatopsis sp. GM8]